MAVALNRLRWVEEKWRQFKLARAEYDEQIRRNAAPVLPESLRKWGEESARGVQSPMLEWISGISAEIRMLNPTKIDVVTLEKGPEAKRDAEKLRIRLAGSWQRQNANRQLDQAAFQAMGDHGLVWERKLWKQPGEPDEKYYGGEKDAGKRDKRRRDWFVDEEREFEFETVTVNADEVSCWPPDPERFTEVWHSCEVSLPDAYDQIQNDKGERPALDDEERLGWLASAAGPPGFCPPRGGGPGGGGEKKKSRGSMSSGPANRANGSSASTSVAAAELEEPRRTRAMKRSRSE